MVRSPEPDSPSLGYNLPGAPSQSQDTGIQNLPAIAKRFNQEYQGQPFELPAEVEAMAITQQWRSGQLQAVSASPFWEMVKPQKKQHCLDLGCGIGFLVYPWREWGAFFHGQDISTVARDALVARGPQLNSMLFKGVVLKPAHQLDDYDPAFFDLAIATGLSCYYPPAYWEQVLTQVKRVLKPGQPFVFDVVNGELELAENWAILETYLGAEVFLESLGHWQTLIRAAGAKIVKQKAGDLFHLFKIVW
ncbi:class I SAM-dependent methyltransferase [Prochlorothrix hollandica]|uniref:class I SAM-dependent methyltransferase n=1 Tax=Prochlorothrix hollandica TaxID=1223 RepID=UPI003342103B